jgi:NADPH:quinone reductase and related Zn-dependent oxidoreductases
MIRTRTLICKSLSDDMSGVELVEKQINEPNVNEILIKVKAASVNFPDLLMTQGKYQHKT